MSLARLLQTWLGADHGWRPSTVAGYRSVVAFLVADPLGRRRASTLTPAVVRVACTGWLTVRVSVPSQVLLLCRLAADTGARHGELAALQLGDLDGRVLTTERAASGEVIGPTKTRTVRRLTLGPTSTDLWQASVQAWHG